MFITTINNEIECRFQVETIDDMRTRAHTANAPTVLSFQSIVGESFRCQRDKATSDENDFVFFFRLISLCNRIEEWTHTRVNCVAHMPSAEQDKSLIDFCAHFFFASTLNG